MGNSIRITEQTRILRNCIAHDQNLPDVLLAKGLTYDDLRYRHNSTPGKSTVKYRPLEEFRQFRSEVPAVSFFTGCGGLDIGFEYAGFRHLAMIENHELFCETLRRNWKDVRVIGPPEYSGDLSQLDKVESILRTDVGISIPFEGVFHGGPPCQPFSVAANQRFSRNGRNFKRIGYAHSIVGNLLFDFIHYIEVFRPRAFLIENVPGLYTMDNGRQLNTAVSSLQDSGYHVTEPTLVNAADYGIPQERSRLLIVGLRLGGTFLPPLKNNDRIPCHVVFANRLNGAPNHTTRRHRAGSIVRYMELRYGERDKLGRVDRLDPVHPSKTVIAGGTGGGGRSHLHPEVPRTISPRESARLQTFPDDYELAGSPSRQFTQIGNAVPPLLAYKFARAIRQSL